jgi:MoxR-like ATPase
VFDGGSNSFRLRHGPAFTNRVARRRDQPRLGQDAGALLEVMQEGQITIEGESRSSIRPS